MIHEEILLSGGATLTTYIQDSEIHHDTYKNKPAMIICPGGAYLIHATGEGEPAAMEFMRRGFQCFLLRYAVGSDKRYPDRAFNDRTPYPTQVLQLMEAVHLVRVNVAKWHILEDKIFTIGFSAGGHVAASLAVRWNDPDLHRQLSFVPGEQELKPAGVILGYPMLRMNSEEFMASAPSIAQEQTGLMHRALFGTETPTSDQINKLDIAAYVTEDTAPVFLWNCLDDPVVECGHAFSFIQKLKDCHIHCEYHMFSRGGHGQPLFSDLTMTQEEMQSNQFDPAIGAWVDMAMAWIRSL